MSETVSVPKALRAWFVLHFVVDVAFAVPLMIVPGRFLTLLGWQTVDPIATRMVSAALLGIGIESFLGRNGPAEQFAGMLSLKIIWSSAVIIALVLSAILKWEAWPFFGWALIALFVGFNLLWVYWKLRVGKLQTSS